MRRRPITIVSSITKCLEDNTGVALPPTKIAQLSGLNYQACNAYLGLIKKIQEMPRMESIKTHKGEMFKIEMTALPLKEQKAILKEEFNMNYSKTDEIYIALLEENAFSPKTAVKAKMNPIIKKGLKFKHLKQTKDKKVYLTKTGRIIAKGAKELFSEN
ncbi:MAG: hypothetical protein AB1467_02485 [Candidatus Diapherotrites archaeon]